MENKPKSPVGFTFSDAEVATVDKLLGTLADLSVRVPFTKRTDYPQALKQLAAAAFPSAGP